jgi:hypothetical protein
MLHPDYVIVIGKPQGWDNRLDNAKAFPIV